MSHIKCDFCSKNFYKKPSQIKRSNKNYCSIECSSGGRKKGNYIGCYFCGKKSYKKRKDIAKNQSGKFFCSMNCSLAWRNSTFVGSKHPNWKTGKATYKPKLKRQKDIPQKCVLCKESNIKILAVHHVDKDRDNNHLSNLVWLCHNCHHLVHNYKTEETLLHKKLKQ